MPPPSCQDSTAKPSLLLALVCASIVAAHDRTWLARPVCALIGAGGPRPEHVSRIKVRVLASFAALVAAATAVPRLCARPGRGLAVAGDGRWYGYRAMNIQRCPSRSSAR